MVVQHNLPASNGNRQLDITNNILSKNAEKLASGYRINRSADDAAGLSISEKMRKQIRGLTQASQNAEDGISFVQTTEGALQEVHDMLQRGRELAIQAANGTNSASERQAIQQEISQLNVEIDRIGSTTKFNEEYVFVQREIEEPDSTPLVASKGEVEAQTISLSYIDAIILREDDFAGAASAIGVTETAMRNFATELKNNYLPKILGQLENTVFAGFTPTSTTGKIEMGLDLYSAPGNGTLAYVSSNGKGFELGINVNYLTKNGDNIRLDDDFATTIAHELTHGIMFDIVTNGMLGVNGGDAFPGYIIEGIAQVVGGAMNYVDASKLTSSSSIKEYMKDLDAGGYASYAQGYLASAYLGYACGDGVTVSSQNIANGINKLLKDVYNGYSLAEAISRNSNGKFGGLTDFETKVKSGDPDMISFIKSFKAAVGSGAGSAALMSLSDSKSSFNSYAGANGDYFELNVDKLYAQTVAENNSRFAGNNAYNGGGATKTSGATRNGSKNNNAKNNWVDVSTGSSRRKNGLRSISLHVGADSDDANKINFRKIALSTEALTINQISVSTEKKATEALDIYDYAIERVSNARSYLGAIQNRLEHTIKNLDNVVENTTASESLIRDTDMAKTMVAFSNNNILKQAGQAILVQANQMNQGVLSLLSK